MGQGGSSPDSGGLPFDAVTGADQPQLSPEQMQQLAATYGVQLSPKSGGQTDLSKMMTNMGNNNSNFPAQTPQSQEEAYYQSHPLPEQAKLETNYPNPTQSQQRRRPKERNQDEPALLHRANPYADIPSLYDLYSQYSQHPITLARFGLDIFENGTGNFDQLPMDLTAGPEYVLGPGDG